MKNTKNNIDALTLALSLCGVGTKKDYYITLNFEPVMMHDPSHEGKNKTHYTTRLVLWQEVGVYDSPQRWGYITDQYRVTQCEGSFPNIKQNPLYFGSQNVPIEYQSQKYNEKGEALPLTTKPKINLHDIEIFYSNNRWKFFTAAAA